jgi:putative spermidine/putrescine transport system permease protein
VSASGVPKPRAIYLAAALGVLILAVPTLVVLAASLTTGNNIVFPPRGLTLDWYGRLAESDAIWRGLQHSLYVGFVATVIDALAAVPAALALDRARLRGRAVIRVFLSLGVMAPIVVSAMAFLTIFIELRLLNDLLYVGVAIAAVNFPFMLWTVSSALNDQDPELVSAAATLGADPVEQFLFVRLPLLAPGIVTGALLVFVLSITDFVLGVVLTNVDTATLPVVIYSGLRSNVSPLLGAATVVFIVVAAVACATVLRFGRLEQFVFRR